MSNLIPSLETFAKAGRRSVHLFVSPSVFRTTPQAERILLALLGYFQAVFLRLVAHGFVCIGDGCDGRGIEHVGSVFTRSLVLLTSVLTLNLSRTGMGLLYYGQNFLIYPSAFPAGARESEFPSPPVL
jgi:hypothetical protein